MPLLDHFHPPLNQRRSWHAFHNSWATYLSAHLNRLLPEGYFAAANVQFAIEIDVAATDDGGTAFPSAWSPGSPTLTIPLAILHDSIEVQIFSGAGGPTRAGAIELVSPRNKDRPASRQAFVSKCAAYVQFGIGLLIVDVVTDRQADLHAELLARLDFQGQAPSPTGLYVAAYHPVRQEEVTSLDIWQEVLHLGQSLPTLPLWLRAGPCLPVDLEATYEGTRNEQRVGLNGVQV